MLGDYKNKWAYNNAFHEPYVMPVEVVIGVGLFVYCWAKTYLLSRDYEKYLENNQSVASEFKPVWVYQLLIDRCRLIAIIVTHELWLFVHKKTGAGLPETASLTRSVRPAQ